jgi:hypothetical protein
MADALSPLPPLEAPGAPSEPHPHEERALRASRSDGKPRIVIVVGGFGVLPRYRRCAGATPRSC